MSNKQLQLTAGLRPDSGKRAWGHTDMESEVGKKDDEFGLLEEEEEPKGCWASFTGCIGGIWATRQMTNNKDREIYVRTTLRELVVYLVFLAVLCIITFGMTSPVMYYYTKVMSELFLDSPFPNKNTFRGSTQVMDFWRFTENVMLDGLYWEYWYNEKNPKKGHEYDYGGNSTIKDDRNILYENRLLGLPRLRQLRVNSDSCVVDDKFARAIRQCYSIYSPSVEDKQPFGLKNSSAWKYYTAKQLHGSTHWGLLASYGGGGSYQTLKKNRAETKEVLAELKENLWISRATRAVFLDFTVYNANINLFCVVKMVFEFPATGGLIPSWSFRTVKLLRYISAFDYFVLACEGIFCFFVVYYIVEELMEIHQLGWEYFKAFWNILDIVVITICILCIVFSVYRYLEVTSTLEALLQNDTKYEDFEDLGFWQTQFNNMIALAIFFAWIKLFKYISFNKTMNQLNSTLSRCAKDVGGFAIMFGIVFFAFAQLGYLLFGTQVKDFSTFDKSVFTLLRTILGDFNFHEIEAANRVLGPLFFLGYVFFVFFVLINMFLAIINDTYSEVKSEISQQKNEFEITDYFKRGYNNMMGKMGKRDKLVDIQNALKLSDANAEGALTFADIRANLKKCNFSDLEIEMFFARYDLDGDRCISDKETKLMMADLEGKRVELSREIEEDEQEVVGRPRTGRVRPGSAVSMGGVADADFNRLQKRVDRLEHSLGNVTMKIDNVLSKLDSMEKSKHKRRETMSKILNTITETDGVDDKTKREQMEKLMRDELEKWDDIPGRSRPTSSLL